MVCCVTGHRPKGFPFPYSRPSLSLSRYRAALIDTVDELIRTGYTHFITGMALGADLDFAEAVLALKRQYEGRFTVTLEAAIPCPDQCKKWKSEDVARYQKILAACDESRVLSPYYTPGCMHQRNEYMVDKADLVFGIWNGKLEGGTWSTLCYAKKKNKPIRLLRLHLLVKE